MFGNLSVYDQIMNEIESGVFSSNATIDATVATVDTVKAVVEEFTNVKNNLGPFAIFYALLIMGILMLIFSWGEDLVEGVIGALNGPGNPNANPGTATGKITPGIVEEAVAL